MANDFFQFKKFVIRQDRCAMKVCTDSCLFGAVIGSQESEGKTIANSVLDIGGGTGLLSLMVAQKIGATIDAVDIDGDAIEQMRQNFLNSLWDKRLNAIHADARELRAKKKYDLIISNPPFYEKELKSDDDKITLARHDAGMVLSDLAEIIDGHLDENGRFHIMIPAYRSGYMTGQLTAKNLFVNKEITVSHSAHHSPFRIILSGNRKPKVEEPERVALYIWDGEDYSIQFKNLLQDYYLHL